MFSGFSEADIPVARDLDATIAPEQSVAGQESLDAAKESGFAHWGAIGGEIGEGGIVQLRGQGSSGEQGFDFGSEVERAVLGQGVIKRLDAEAVAGEEQLAAG